MTGLRFRAVKHHATCWQEQQKCGWGDAACVRVSLPLRCVLAVGVMAYRGWAENCISLAALAELAHLVLTKRECAAILWGETLTSASSHTNSHSLKISSEDRSNQFMTPGCAGFNSTQYDWQFHLFKELNYWHADYTAHHAHLWVPRCDCVHKLQQ